MKSKKASPLKILLGIVIGLALLVIIAMVAFHIYIRATYAAFYSEAEAVFPQPGIGDGFITQDLCLVDGEDDPDDATWFFSGYMGEGKPSPIYVRHADGSVSKFEMRMPDGKVYDGHGGGLTVNDKFLYVTDETGYLLIYSLNDAIKAEDGGTIDALGTIYLGIEPAFLNIQDGVLRTGVFYHAGPYETPENQHLTAPDGTKTNAVMYEYQPDPSAEFGYGDVPSRVYAIPDMAQGVAIDGAGNMVFSTSWSINTSHLISYSVDKMTETGTFDTGKAEVPLVYCDGTCLAGSFGIPPMSEGIVWAHGKLYISCEAASNKYIFGKFYGAETLYALSKVPL